MLPAGTIMISQSHPQMLGGGTAVPFINHLLPQSPQTPFVYIRGSGSSFDVNPTGLQTYTLVQQNSTPLQLQPQILTQQLQPTVQALPTSALQQFASTLQGSGPSTIAYLSPQLQSATKRRASDCASPSTAAIKNADSKKPKLDSSSSRRVLRLVGLPNDVTQSELIQLSAQFGGASRILLNKGNSEAFVEMADTASAQIGVTYYGKKSLTLRNHLIRVQLSENDDVDFPSQDTNESLNSKAELSPQSSNEVAASPVLAVSVENVIYNVTVDAIKTMFSQHGQVVAIATYVANESTCLLIEFADSASAEMAKTALNGQCMYLGGNKLKVEYSSLTSLEPHQSPAQLSYPSFESPSLMQPFVFETSLQQPQAVTIINPSNILTKSGTKGIFPIGAAQLIDPKYMPQYGTPLIAYNNDSALAYNQVLAPTLGISQGGLLLPPRSLLPTGNVLMVSNLDETKVSPDALFTLFGVYGDVSRVKIMFNKKDTALIQFNDAAQAQTALLNLDKLKLWGKVIKVAPSKNTSVQMPKDGQPDAGLTKDYKNSQLYRFKKPYSANYKNIFPPSSTLHLSNIPSTSKERLIEIFSDYGTVVGFKFFNNVISANRDCKMALMQMASIEEAAHALIGLHNYQLAETTHLRVSFSKSCVVSQPATADAQQDKHQTETESAIQNVETPSVIACNNIN